jgi:glycerol-3-phosphate O-acyltransferase / dihydroxyacetone phosphate acyltransferase
LAFLRRSSPTAIASSLLIDSSLIDLFSTAALGPDYVALKQALLSYDSLLQSSRFTNADLAFLPLSSDLDPLKDIPTPTRLMTLSLLIRDTLILAIRFPFFLLPALIHVPIYLVGRFGGKLATDEEETQAQNKMVLGLLLSAIVNGSLFAILWTFFRRTAIGAIVAALTIWATFVYHRKMIDENYDQ